jgi:transcriptional regulator with XRE-family HTH domain
MLEPMPTLVLPFSVMSPERTDRLLKRVEKWRKENGVMQKELAKRLNMTPQQLNDILKGRTQLTGEQALALLELLEKKG